MTTTELSSQRIDQRTNIWSERSDGPDGGPVGRREGRTPGIGTLAVTALPRAVTGCTAAPAAPAGDSKHCMEVDP